MLENSFCHIPGIGEKTEQWLWRSGLLSWGDVWNPFACRELPSAKRASLCEHIGESQWRLAEGDSRFFAQRLPPHLHWRLFREFRDATAYVDIETTGMGGDQDCITTIALYDGNNVRCYIHGENLLDFRDDIEAYRLLVTFNGKTFDVPFLRRYLGMAMDMPHIDLRYLLRTLGYRGGLKACEKQMGLDRGDLEGIDGYCAVLLWHEYVNHHDERALETLLAYNIEDVLNLETLMVRAYNLKVAETPFAHTLELPEGDRPAIPYAPDREMIEKLRWRLYQQW
jgi:uncharacterized protein YprB with RNaseH-like and TPR domain